MTPSQWIVSLSSKLCQYALLVCLFFKQTALGFISHFWCISVFYFLYVVVFFVCFLVCLGFFSFVLFLSFKISFLFFQLNVLKWMLHLSIFPFFFVTAFTTMHFPLNAALHLFCKFGYIVFWFLKIYSKLFIITLEHFNFTPIVL